MPVITPSKSLRVGVLGSRGAVGMQAVRLLACHPAVLDVVPFASEHVGKPYASLHPTLRSVLVGKLRRYDAAALAGLDALIHCGGSVSVQTVIEDSTNQLVVDVGSSLRIQDGHPPGRQCATVIPELDGDLVEAHGVLSLQGCVPTASLLVLVPLLKGGLLRKGPVFLDAKVGSSGGGLGSESYASLHANRSSGVRPFRLLSEHRHVLEMRSYLAQRGLPVPELSLAVFSVDMVRGVSVAMHTKLEAGVTEEDLRRLLRATYASEECVSLLSLKAGPERLPNPRWLAHTGICQIGFQIDEDSGMTTLISALDNLMKGGASQAVQVLNRAMGLPNSLGVPMEAHYP